MFYSIFNIEKKSIFSVLCFYGFLLKMYVFENPELCYYQ